MIRIPDRFKRWTTPIKAAAFVKGYLIVLGIVTFPLFINEEAVQVAQGGTWAAKAAKDWESMRMGCDLVEETANALRTTNLFVGWLNPFGYAAYEHYARNSLYYAATCHKQADAGTDGKRKGRDDSQ